MRIVGLDLSLTRTGIACHLTPESPYVGGTWTDVATSKGKATDGLIERAARLSALSVDTIDWVRDADLVVVEAPAHGSVTGHHHDRSGLWWMVVGELARRHIPVAEVAPTALKRYATGKGNAGKDEVLLAVAKRFPGVEVTCNDEADALVLCAMGARHLGEPIDDMPASHLTAMDKVRWPDISREN